MNEVHQRLEFSSLHAGELDVVATLGVDDQIKCAAAALDVALLLARHAREFDHGDVRVADVRGRLVDEDEASVHGVQIAVVGLHRALDRRCLVVTEVRARHGDLLLGELADHPAEYLVDLARHLLLEPALLGQLALHFLEGHLEIDLRGLIELQHEVRVSRASLPDRRVQADHEAHVTVVGLWQLEDVRDGTVHDLVVVGLTVQAKEGGIDLDVVTTSGRKHGDLREGGEATASCGDHVGLVQNELVEFVGVHVAIGRKVKAQFHKGLAVDRRRGVVLMEFEGDLVLLQHALSHVREGDLERRPVSHLKHHSRASHVNIAPVPAGRVVLESREVELEVGVEEGLELIVVGLLESIELEVRPALDGELQLEGLANWDPLGLYEICSHDSHALARLRLPSDSACINLHDS